MNSLIKLLLLSSAFLTTMDEAYASDHIAINTTNKAPLFDGRCDQSEWATATKFTLPAEIDVYLMHDERSLFICAKGKMEDYTVLDLYIENEESGQLYNLHASAQLQERLLTDSGWTKPGFWNNKDWSGFWVPYAGEEDTEQGTRTKFLEGSDREIQVLRKKFVGNTWNMMIRVSGVYHEGKYGAEFFYPKKAVDTDKLSWRKFSFSK
jgi:hypothetical protein